MRPSGFYPWLKALHVIAIIAWMAGMLYLPRLFVYHCEAEPGSQQSETFKVMERRLLLAIINPAMVASWALGLWLAWDGGWYAAGWFQAKLACVLAMSAVHGFFVRCVRDFATDQNRHSQKFYRIINEVPTLSDDRHRDPRGGQAVLSRRSRVCPTWITPALAYGTFFSYLVFISRHAGRCIRVPARVMGPAAASGSRP